MCKFNQRLFISVFVLCLIECRVFCFPIDFLLDDFNDEEISQPDYDLHYDERQNGTENYRLKINGVLIAIPSSITSNSVSTIGSIASNYLLLNSLGSSGGDDNDHEDGDQELSESNSSDDLTKNQNQNKTKFEEQKKHSNSYVVHSPSPSASPSSSPSSSSSSSSSSSDTRSALTAELLTRRRSSTKLGHKRRNKIKMRLASVIDYLKKVHSKN